MSARVMISAPLVRGFRPTRGLGGARWGMGDEQIIDSDVQCGGKGLQVGVHESCLHGTANRFSPHRACEILAPTTQPPRREPPWNQSSR